MIEIKFRCWDVELSRMIPIAYLGIGSEGDITHIEDCPISDKVILMQYIGLKDKNDKEIYEGDLVRCIAEEKYCKDSGVYPIEYDLFEQQFRPNFACHLGWGGWTSIEVIGNVYENPELVTNV